jgi:hypothetical protein
LFITPLAVAVPASASPKLPLKVLKEAYEPQISSVKSDNSTLPYVARTLLPEVDLPHAQTEHEGDTAVCGRSLALEKGRILCETAGAPTNTDPATGFGNLRSEFSWSSYASASSSFFSSTLSSCSVSAFAPAFASASTFAFPFLTLCPFKTASYGFAAGNDDSAILY